MLKYILVVLFLSYGMNSYGQYDFKNKKEIFAFNVISNGLMGGIGALVNSNHKEKKISTFLKGLYKGAISGMVIYTGKELISDYYNKNNYTYYWGSKLFVYTGSSMLENTVNNKKLFEQIHFDVAFLRFDFYPYNKYKLKTRIMPISLALTTCLASTYKINYELTLKSGYFVFEGQSIFNKKSYGSAYGNNILISKTSSKYPLELTISHETIHIFQLSEVKNLNIYYIKLQNRIFQNKSNFFIKYNKYFYNDYHIISHSILYQAASFFGYRKNIFESEAFYLMDK